MIKPTVGRIVLFTPASDDQELNRGYGPSLSAIIAKVWNEHEVNLTVFGPDGLPHPRPRVRFIQGNQLPDYPEQALCTWMDYQRGQAARSDELVATLTARIEALEATEANRGQVSAGEAIAINGLETALTATDPKSI